MATPRVPTPPPAAAAPERAVSPEEQEARKVEADNRATEIRRTDAMRRARMREANRAMLGTDKLYNWVRQEHEKDDSVPDPTVPTLSDGPGSPPADQDVGTGVYRDALLSDYSFYYNKEKSSIKPLGGSTEKSIREAMFFARDKLGWTGIVVDWPKHEVDEDRLRYILKVAKELKLAVTFSEGVQQQLIGRQKDPLTARSEPDAKEASSVFAELEKSRLETVAISKEHFDRVREQLKIHDAAADLDKTLADNPNRLSKEQAADVMNDAPDTAAADKIKSDFEKLFKNADGTDLPPDAMTQKIESELKKLEDRQKKLQAFQEKVDLRITALDDRKSEVERFIAEKQTEIDGKRFNFQKKVPQKELAQLKNELQFINDEQARLVGGTRKQSITEESARIKLQHEVLRAQVGRQPQPLQAGVGQQPPVAPAQPAVAPTQPAVAPTQPAVAPTQPPVAPTQQAATAAASTQTPAANQDALTRRLDALRDSNKSLAQRVNPTIQPVGQQAGGGNAPLRP